jgi:hypothetical protein
MALPSRKRSRKSDIAQSNTLLFGEPKIGKTTLQAQMPNAIILDTENGTGFLDVYVVPVTDYPSFIQTVGELTEQPHDFGPICLDTLDNIVRLCAAEVCRQQGVRDLADLPYGKGYSLLANGVIQILARLASLNRGLWLTTHVKEVEIDVPGVGKVLRAEPSLPNSVARQVLAFCDFIFYLHSVPVPAANDSTPRVERVIETKPANRWCAGDRTGRLPPQLPCDYLAIRQAFELAMPSAANVSP